MKNKSWKGLKNSRKQNRRRKKNIEDLIEKIKEKEENGGTIELKGILLFCTKRCLSLPSV